MTGIDATSFKVWISKYALTQGIYEITAIRTSHNETIVYDTYNRVVLEGREWHLTREGAVTRANALRNAKIDNLKKQIDKLTNLEFD